MAVKEGRSRDDDAEVPACHGCAGVGCPECGVCQHCRERGALLVIGSAEPHWACGRCGGTST